MSLFAGIAPPRWRFLILPLSGWLAFVVVLATGLLWLDRESRTRLEERFNLRAVIAADFVATHVDELLRRERDEATAFLTAPVVDRATFVRSVTAFGYSAGVLLDDRGRLLHVTPFNPGMIGRDLTAQYAHLRTAVLENRPAVSPVVRAAGNGAFVVAFATPYGTPEGRRIFSGALEVAASPLGGYLRHAIALEDSTVHLLDPNGMIVSSGQPPPAPTGRLATHSPALATAIRTATRGTVTVAGQARYFAAEPVRNTPWRLVATVPLDQLYEPVRAASAGGQVAGVIGAGLALLGVLYSGRNRRNRSRLRASEQRFRGLFENTMVGMAFTGLDGRFRTVNQALCQLVGYPATYLQSGGWRQLTHPEDRGLSTRMVAETIAGKQRGFSFSKRYLHSDGHLIHVDVTSTLLRDEWGKPLHFVTQIVDVSERYRLQQEQQRSQRALAEQAVDLRRFNAELQDANRRIADLVTMMTHDVRQPLAAISGYCALLLETWDGHSDAERRADLRRLAAAGRAANEMVEAALTLAQLDTDAPRPVPTRIRVSAAFAEALESLSPDDRARFTVEVEPDVAVLADPRHLHQILVNLIGNAGKYGAAPAVLRAARTGDAVEITVSDAGEGVPPDFVPRLFDRFSRARTGIAQERKGTGVGLYIVRQLAEANGASVTYEPNTPHGSRFTLRLPSG